MLDLAKGDYRLLLEPERGGSIAALQWRGHDLLRPSRPGSVLETASFPLVPFSNRIAHGHFVAHGRSVQLLPNFPGSDHPHPLHGFGWLAGWDVSHATSDEAELVHRHTGGQWPWPYVSTQRFRLTPQGMKITLALENLGEDDMPAGLGFHPYFPRDADTRYHGLHRGEWQTGEDGLPRNLVCHDDARDWWDGQPVASRCVDTVYVGRRGDLTIEWPSRHYGLTLAPSAALTFTVVYTPAGEAYFCVEPVTHMTDAVNHPSADNGLVWLPPRQRMEVALHLSAYPMA